MKLLGHELCLMSARSTQRARTRTDTEPCAQDTRCYGKIQSAKILAGKFEKLHVRMKPEYQCIHMLDRDIQVKNVHILTSDNAHPTILALR